MKNAIKKAISVLLVAVMVLGSAPLAGFVGLELPEFNLFSTKAEAATYSGTCGEDLAWTLDTETGELVISGTGEMTYYREIYQNGNLVTGAPWGVYVSSIKIAMIYDGVTSIGESAFAGCLSLENITIPDSVINIARGAFRNCSSLKSVTIPKNVTDIGYDVFEGCDELTAIYFTGNLEQWNNISISNFNEKLFEKFILNKHSGTSYLSRGRLGTGMSWALFSNGELFINGTGKMPNYSYASDAPWADFDSSIKSVTLLNGVNNIGNYAFYGCSELASIKIPDTVSSIGDYAFEYEIDATIYYVAKREQWEKISVGTKNGTFKSIVYECDSETPYYGKGRCGENLTWILYADGELEISGTGKMDCNFEDGMGGTCRPWQGNCLEIKMVTIEEGVTSIDDNAFSDCNNLTSITIPNSVTRIGYGAFAYCLSLTTLTIPESVTTIESYVFRNCDELDAVYFNGTVEQWNSVAIDKGNEFLAEILVFKNNPEISCLGLGVCGDNLTWKLYSNGELVISGTGYMSDYSSVYPAWNINTPWFSERSKIKTVIIGDGITSIGTYAFSGCTSLESITIPDSVISIGNRAFYNCTSLESVTIGNSVTSIGGGAFNGCTSLTSIEIPDSVTNIDDYAFSKCTSFTSIEIPDSVTRIGYGAFENCDGLRTIIVDENNLHYSSDEYGVLFSKDKTTLISYPAANPQTSYIIPDSVTSINSFGKAENLISVTIPAGVTRLYSVFCNCTSLKEVTMPVAFDYYAKDAFPISVEKFILTKGKGEMPNFAYDYPPDYDYSGSVRLYSDLPWSSKNIKEIIICDGATNIGNYAFYGSSAKIIIPDSVTKIGCNAFSDRVEVYYSGMVEQWKQIAIDKHNENLFKNVIIDYKSDNACYGAGDCGDNLSWILYVDGKFEISGTDDMENWASLSDVPWDYRRSEIKEISVPGEVTSISPYAFSNCTNLEKVEILGYSVEIADNAFSNSPNVILYCKSGSTVQSYAELNNLMYVLIDGSTADFAVKNNQLVAYKGSSANPKIPSGVTSIGANAFNGNVTVKTLELPVSVTSIFSGAFADCSPLEEVFIPHTVTTIAVDAFNGTNARIVCYANSIAHQFAVDNGIEFELVKVILNETAIVLKVGEYSIITAAPEQEYLDSIEMSWKSSDTNIATVDGNGKVTAKSNGEVTISAIAPNGATLATCSVNVIPNEYNVSWVVEGNTTIQVYEVGETIVAPATPIKNGYRFVGWTPSVPSTMPNYDLTFAAVFEVSGPVNADVVNRPTQTTISYGDSIVLHVDASKIPVGGRVEWTASNGNFSYSANGTTCEIRPEKSGDTTFTATIYDAKGNAVSNDEQTMTSKAGFFDKIIAFFKKLFGLTKTIPEAVKVIY